MDPYKALFFFVCSVVFFEILRALIPVLWDRFWGAVACFISSRLHRWQAFDQAVRQAREYDVSPYSVSDLFKARRDTDRQIEVLKGRLETIEHVLSKKK